MIFEGTPVVAFKPATLPRFVTPYGDVRARTIVLAGEAYLTQLRPLHRQSLPVYSLIVLTEPISDAQWAEIGWRGNECIASARYTIDYLSRTTDGRILFGGRGAPYHYASRIDDRFDRHGPTHQALKEMVVKWFPMLEGVKFSHEWGGPIAVARDWMPTISYSAAQGLATARSYIGQGVATTNLAGRILADMIVGDMIVGIESPISKLAIVGHHSPNWEIEPLRWLGVRYVQNGLQRIDKRAERTARPPTGRTLAERLAGH
jgi:glycine/D-amino acid oxidase-like deaminating enzyme